MITWRKYISGDIARVDSIEPDPFEGWADQAEREGRALTTILRDGLPIVATGLIDSGPGEAWCFAVVDRTLASGNGKQVITMMRARLHQAMDVLGIHTVRAEAGTSDRAACVFLRAAGFRPAGSNGSTTHYTIHRSTANEQGNQDHQEA